MIKSFIKYIFLKYENVNLLNIKPIKKYKDWLILRITTSELQRQKRGNFWIEKELEKMSKEKIEKWKLKTGEEND